ncbi:MAG: hypothetical protein QW097_01930, partial [archaeon]
MDVKRRLDKGIENIEKKGQEERIRKEITKESEEALRKAAREFFEHALKTSKMLGSPLKTSIMLESLFDVDLVPASKALEEAYDRKVHSINLLIKDRYAQEIKEITKELPEDTRKKIEELVENFGG